MYRIKIRFSGKLSELLTDTSSIRAGDVCVFRSRAYAQSLASVVAGYGLLG